MDTIERRWSATVRVPFATLGLVTDGRALTELHFLARDEPEQPPSDAIAERGIRELERYLDDPQFRFGVPIALHGTAFQRRVWNALVEIPVGESRTYGALARALDSVPRAVGQACGANPIAVIVPCHRVVGGRGGLGGFMNHSSGDPLAIKRWLLAHEHASRDLFALHR